MNGTGIGEVRTKLLDTDHKQWNCGMGVFDPGVVFYKQDKNGYVIIDGKRCKLVEKPDTSDPSVAILNGEVLENSFYKNPNDDIICSKLVDSISLPDGYNKCYYVYNSNPTSGTTDLLTTNIKLVEKYGHAYCTAKVNVLNTQYGSIYSNGAGGANNVTRMLLGQSNTRCIIYSNMAGGGGGQNIYKANHIFSYEMTEDGKYREILVDANYKTLDNYVQGEPNTDEELKFLSTGSEVNLYYMFVIDDNKNVTNCFIPCQNATTGQFGLYEVVSNQFFGSDSLAGYGELLEPAPMTLRFEFSDNTYDPTVAGVGSSGTWSMQTGSKKNVWDWTNTNTSWATAFGGGSTTNPGAFADYDNNKVKVLMAGDTSTVTDFSRLFQNCYAITEICPIDTSNASTVFLMFSHCENCTKFPDMNFSNAIANNGTAAVYQSCLKMKKAPNIKFPSNNNFSLANFFYGCKNLEEVPLYDTHKCTAMNSMFSGVFVNSPSPSHIVEFMNLKKVPLFDTSNVTTMKQMFAGCYKLKDVPLFDTGNVITMQSMFLCCISLTTVPNFDTNKVSNMSNMFTGRTFNTDLGDLDMHISEVPNFDYSKVTLFDDFFSNNVDITEIPDMNIEANVTKCNNMFINCKNVQTGAKSLYDKLSVKSSITNHTNCFKNCGSDTETGRAELAQIPTSWGGELE